MKEIKSSRKKVRNLEVALTTSWYSRLADHAHALSVLFRVRARARLKIRWRSRLRERLNRCRVAVVLGRWVYSLVCEPAYRPMRWLVSQRTPWPLSRGFSRSPLFPSSCCRFLPAPLRWRTSTAGMCTCVLARTCVCVSVCTYTRVALHRAR